MGKGDQRSRRGKIHRGTFGRRRPKQSKSAVKPVVAAESAPKKHTRKEAAATEEFATARESRRVLVVLAQQLIRAI